MSKQPVIRIHPAIGFARVGNSGDFYLAPETPAGMPQDGSALTGGLPIKPGTEDTPISDADLRDSQGALKRQAQRFRLYHYLEPDKTDQYPYSGSVSEITIGSKVGNKTVVDIVWTVHLANKKANCWQLVEDVKPGFISSLAPYDKNYDNGKLPPMRNPDFAGTDDPSDRQRLSALVIDAGPRTVRGAKSVRVPFDASSTPSAYIEGEGVQKLPDYPTSYPQDHFKKLNSPSGTPVSHLGAMQTDQRGRLLVIGGQGTASGWYADENRDQSADDKPLPLGADVNNDGWFDDTADGPVNATLFFDDGTTQSLANTAWAVSTDPAYAPQIRNIVTLWDEAYDTWLHNFGLDKNLYQGEADPKDDSGYNKDYKPSFAEDIFPMFRSAHLQMFTTGLNDVGLGAHARLDNLSAQDDPKKYLNIKSFIRNPYPDQDEFQESAPKMPLSLGDTGAAFLTLSKTQYFFLNQWYDKHYTDKPTTELTAGERLDRDALSNCLGGRFSPGIDMTFIIRDPVLYDGDWHQPHNGPFRLNKAKLDYRKANPKEPFLSVGYTPERSGTRVEPGDICKFMAIPWHTDYNSCATHLPSPNPGGPIKRRDQVSDGRNTTLFWSWPAQRPVSVYTYEDLKANDGTLPEQRYSVRGDGTRGEPGTDGAPFAAENVGRFQVREDIVKHWQDIGTVLQGPAIEGYTFDQNYYLEAASRMSRVSDRVEPWPNQVTDKTHPVD